MKNVIKLFAFVLLFALSSCSGQTPRDVAKEAMTCLQNQDYKGYVDLMQTDESKSPEEIEKSKATLANILQEKAGKSMERKGGIKDFKVIKETVNDEKGTATVKMEVEYNDGTTDTDNCKLKKGEDGKWYITF